MTTTTYKQAMKQVAMRSISTSNVLLVAASLLSSFSPALSFVPHVCDGAGSLVSRQSAAASPLHVPHATIATAELETMNEEEQLAALGLDDAEKLALGITPAEVLEFIGT